MRQSTEKKALSMIYGNGRGWAFSQKDFARIGSRAAIDTALHRLHGKGTIRRVLRGLYDYPRFSDLLDRQLAPDTDQVARALARKFGWSIQPSGPAALNLMGISSQVPGRIVYFSDGPGRTYDIRGMRLVFRNRAPKEMKTRLRESGLIVRGLKALGRDHVTPEVIERMRRWLDPALRESVLKDVRTATGWVYDAVRRICREKASG